MNNGIRTTAIISEAQPIVAVLDASPVIIAPMLTGAATPGKAYEIINIKDEATRLFGAGSMIQFLIDTFKAYNKESTLLAVGLKDPASGTQASSSCSFSGQNPSEAGSFRIVIADASFEYQINYGITDTPITLASKLKIVVDANPKSLVDIELPSTQNGSFTIKAKNKGTQYNKMPIICRNEIPGIDISISSFSGGAGDHSLTGIFEEFNNQKVDIICPHFAYNICTEFQDGRFNSDSKLLAGLSYTIKTDTLSNLLTLSSSDIKQKKGVFFANTYIDEPLKKFCVSDENFDLSTVTAFVAIRALKLKDGADISKFMNVSLDWGSTGGINQSRRPYLDTILTNLTPCAKKYALEPDEQRSLEPKGLSYKKISDSGLQVLTSNVLLTSKPVSELFTHLNDFDTLNAIREIFSNELQAYVSDKYKGIDGETNVGSLSREKIKAKVLQIWGTTIVDKYNLGSNSPEALKYIGNDRTFKMNVSTDGRVSIMFKILHNGQISEIGINIIPQKI